MKTAKKILVIKSFALFIIIFSFSFLIFNCSRRFEPEPLQLTVKQNLALLQSDPQFVMYFNFKRMRETEFWKKFISDSLFSSERNFGNFLNTLKTATGASISNNIDELYFSNSWIGENAMVIKGTFDQSMINDYVKNDTNYSKISYPNNITIYNNSWIHFYFYFKDDFTLCASNYLSQLEKTISVYDTSIAGLLTNEDAMKVIENIKFKDNLWLMSGQKLFIRGIFENFTEINKNPKNKLPDGENKDTLNEADTSKTGEFHLSTIYKKVNAVSFSLKMTDAINIVMQNNCDDEKSAMELKNSAEAVVTLAKLSAQFSKKKSPAVLKLLDRIDIKIFNNILILETKLDASQVEDIRRQKIF